jgi:hypothetical protein
MTTTSQVSRQQEVKRIGILLADLGKFNIPVLKYLVLQINALQQTFEFEFLPTDHHDEFMQKLAKQNLVNREEIRADCRPFLERYWPSLQEMITGYRLKDTELPEDHLILVTMACFEDKYYTMRQRGISILALGNWKRWMAPPSIVEFILTLVVREAVSFICPTLRGSVHLGTRGCICDFAGDLGDARIKVLSGFVCQYCRASIEAEGLHSLGDDLIRILKKEWLGNLDDPKVPARIASNLGYNLFITKGIKPTFRETFRNIFQQEFTKQILISLIVIIQTVLTVFLLLRLGLNPK